MKKILILLLAFFVVGCKNNKNKVINIKDESVINNLNFKTLSVIKVNGLYSISTQIQKLILLI